MIDDTQIVDADIVLDDAAGLYVIKAPGGVSCLGYDVVYRRHEQLYVWLQSTGYFATAPMERGTLAAYTAYEREKLQAATICRATQRECPILLDERLAPYYRKRVRVTCPDGATYCFWVGKSMGWMPVYLQLAKRNSVDGPAAHLPHDSTLCLA